MTSDAPDTDDWRALAAKELRGADPAALVPNGRLSLNEGAIAAWPLFDQNPHFGSAIAAIFRRPK